MYLPQICNSRILKFCSIWRCSIKVWKKISGTNHQNPFPLYLVKLRNRALKFLVHFSLVCLGKCPKAHEKRGFQKPFSLYFLLLQIVKTLSHCKWVANATGRGFDNLCLNSKCNGKGFSKKFLLEIFEILYHVSKSLWFFFWNFVPYFESLWNFWNFIPCFEILWNFCTMFWNFVKFL